MLRKVVLFAGLAVASVAYAADNLESVRVVILNLKGDSAKCYDEILKNALDQKTEQSAMCKNYQAVLTANQPRIISFLQSQQEAVDTYFSKLNELIDRCKVEIAQATGGLAAHWEACNELEAYRQEKKDFVDFYQTARNLPNYSQLQWRVGNHLIDVCKVSLIKGDDEKITKDCEIAKTYETYLGNLPRG